MPGLKLLIISSAVFISWFNIASAASGTTLDFDGNDYLVASDNAIFDQADRLSLSVWIEPDDTPTDDEYIVYRYNNYYIKMNTSRQIVGAVYGAAWATATSTAVTCDGATWTHIEMTYDKDAGGTDEIKLYINGVLSAVADYSTAIPASSKKLYIGSGDEAGDDTPEKGFDGQIDDVRLYSYARSASDVLLDYNEGLAVHLGPTGKTCSQDPAGCMDYGLVGYWSMDEGTGQTAYDGSGNANNGTLGTGATPDASDPTWTTGKSGGALSFDGVNDYVEVPYADSINLKEKITVIIWAYLPNFDARRISGDKNYHYRWLDFEANTGKYYWHVGNGSSWIFYTVQTWTLPLKEWFQLAYVVDWVNGWGKVYLNRILKSEKTFTAGAIAGNTEVLYIGTHLPKSYPWLGMNAEVRIYNRALSAEEIRFHYNRGRPVAHWRFDEGTGQIAFDQSDNNNDGYLGGTSAVEDSDPTWVQGTYGSALSFDGNDYVSVSPTVSNVQTVSFWIQPSTSTDEILQLTSTHNVQISAGVIQANGFSTPTIYVNGVKTSSITTGVWSHVAVTTETAITANAVKLGLVGADYFVGTLDDVRIYNYARSAEEILVDYNNGLATHFK